MCWENNKENPKSAGQSRGSKGNFSAWIGNWNQFVENKTLARNYTQTFQALGFLGSENNITFLTFYAKTAYC
jgi:hypothetical protein